MCSSGGSRQWDFYLKDMINFAERVQHYTEGLDLLSFLADSRTYDATLRNLELIGEAATHIPDEICESHPEIPWREIIGARNRIIHGYLGIDKDLIWDIVKKGIPELLPLLRLIADSD